MEENDRRQSQEARSFEQDFHIMEGDEDFLLKKSTTAKSLRQSMLSKLGWIAQGIFFILSVLIFIAASKVKPTDIQCAKQLSPYCM